MKKSNLKWFWIGCGILILLNIYSLLERNRAQNISESMRIENSNLDKQFKTFQNNLYERSLLQFRSDGMVLDRNIKLSNPSLVDTLNLWDFFTEKILVVKFTEFNCQVCVEQVFLGFK